MQIDRQDNIQIFHLSKVVHDKFLQQARQHASKNPHLSKQFDKPLLDLEKEFGIDRNKIPKGAVSKTILQTQQENTNKNPKETEKEIKMAVVNTLDHILMILEIQENIEISYQDLKNKTSPMKISPVKGINRSLDMAFLRLNERINPCLLPIGKIVKESLKNRSSEVDSFVPISQLKQFEVAGLNQALSHNGPSNIDSSKLSQFVKNVKNLKDLCLHLTSLLTITSAIYSSVLFKR